MDEILNYLALLIVVIIALPVHEFAHAFAAVKSGDPTPKLAGRYTINPLKHFDIIGLIMLVVVHFGWAKPVPINPYNFRHIKRDYLWVSVAGVISNIAMAFISALLYVLLFKFVPYPTTNAAYYALTFVRLIFTYGILLNLNLFVFNLLPIYPLDGFRVLEVVNKKRGKVYTFLRTKGGYVLIALLIIGAVCDRIGGVMKYFDVLGETIGWLSSNIANFFIKFWELIF